ncbi:sucrase ferredoxin [Actinocorallia longicatena]|uniref:Sucrase ferredoxin n=1 Tax=Actinocorallia longicatena TaxID=111803 RepID=A0ABP6QJP1_9ACTN
MSHGKSCEHCTGSHTGELPCLATATTKARAWLLLEHPGPWAERIEQMGLPIVAEATRAGVRPQLIRRPGRRHSGLPLRVFVGYSGETPWLESRVITDPAELDSLDLAKVARGERPFWGELTDEAVLLVCTHAKRNVCCAKTGGPLARHLAKRYGDKVWETSHVGGDRFAANLVCFPHGLYYGALEARSAETAVEAYLRGEVVLEHLRGRAGLPESGQAAEHFVRQHTGMLDVNAVRVTSVTGTGPFEVMVTAGDITWSGVVEAVETSGTCGSECSESVQTYQMRDLTLHSEAALV